MMRILFGDTEAYKEKFRTSARVRSTESQILGEEFYRKEHTKPLFKKHSILAVQNFYHYHCFMEIYKIIKLRSPTSILAHYEFSKRTCLTYTKILPSSPDNHFIYKSAIIWNTIRAKLCINDLSISTATVKNLVRKSLIANQHFYHEIEWFPTHDFNIGKLCLPS